MKEVRITSCCIFYTLNDMNKNRLAARVPYRLYNSNFVTVRKTIIAVERFFIIP